jgi:16S rRNA processing protein RimM
MEYLLIGRLVKPYGLQGFIKASFFVDDFDDLKPYSVFYTTDRKSPGGYKVLDIEKLSLQKEGFVLKIAGCNDRTAAETLRGIDIYVDQAEVPEPGKNSYYIKDLIGLDFIYEGKTAGKVTNLFEAANRTLIIIRWTDNREMALPFTDDYIESVDIRNNVIIIKNIESFL